MNYYSFLEELREKTLPIKEHLERYPHKTIRTNGLVTCDYMGKLENYSPEGFRKILFGKFKGLWGIDLDYRSTQESLYGMRETLEHTSVVLESIMNIPSFVDEENYIIFPTPDGKVKFNMYTKGKNLECAMRYQLVYCFVY